MSDGNDPSEMRARNLQSLMRFCVEQTAAEDPTTQSGIGAMSEDRREFLRQALSAMEDVVVVMRRHLDATKEFLNKFAKGETDKTEVDELSEKLENLIEIVAELDNATEFEKMDGISVIAPLIETNEKPLQIKACELVAELVQNHPRCQAAVEKANLLETLIRVLETHKDEEVRVKSLYALSCLLRGNERLQIIFEEKHDGLSVLMRAIQTPSVSNKLALKASFLLTSLCQQQAKFRDTLWKMGFVEQIIGLLHKEQDNSHEFLLSALYALISEHKPSLKESLRPELNFKKLLKDKAEKSKGIDEYKEVEEYCARLLELIICNDDTDDTER